MVSRIALCIAVLCTLLEALAEAQHADCDDPFQAPFGANRTWNVYQSCSFELKWNEAHQEAGNADFQGVRGTLASIHSPAENRFVHGLGGRDKHVWIGLTDRVGVAPGAQEGHFVWTSGESLTFANWRRGAPNDSSGKEDGVHLFRNDSNWNDDESGFAINEPIPDPASGSETRGKRYVSVFEFNTYAEMPFPGIDSSPATLPRERLAGPPATRGHWSVTDYFDGISPEAPITEIVNLLLDIQDRRIQAQTASAQFPTLTFADPENPGAKSPLLNLDFGSGLFAYPSNDHAGGQTDDNRFISVAHGRIKPQEDGIYTFQVQSDEGFALRIAGVPVLEVFGAGTADPYGSETFMHAGNSTNSRTRATYDLKAGQEYDVEFLTWEREGGAFVEVAAQLGDQINDPTINPQWIALGDPKTRPESTRFPIARLTGPLHVINMNRIHEFDQEIEFAREIVLENRDNPDAESNDATRFQFDDSNRIPTGCPFGQFPHDGNPAQWPNTAGNRDDFVSGVFGALQVDDGDMTPNELIDVSFYVASDDRSSFRIVGQDFQAASNGGTVRFDGDESIFADQNGCQNSYIGLISLTEGVAYEFEGIHVERSGDAGMQVLAAVGNHVENFNPAEFSLLQLDPIHLSRNIGFQLVSQTDGMVGDYNDNGQLDTEDLDLQAAGIATNDLSFDLNDDTKVDQEDRLVWVRDLKETWIGDANLDGEFNSTDFVDVFRIGLFESGNPALWNAGDWNGDGLFTTADFVLAFQDGGFEAGPRFVDGLATIPEPNGWFLISLSFIALLRITDSRVRRKAELVPWK